jgi:16S rRNA processing protein RimM
MTAPKLLQVAQVAGAFGVLGELRITAYTADPMALADYRDLLREDGSAGLTLVTARAVKGAVIARASGVEDRSQAEALRGLKLYIDRTALPEPGEDEYYLADLVGLTVESPEGSRLGKVKAVNDFGAGDLLEIQPPVGPSFWLPFTREVVPEVDIAAGRVVAIRPQETE